MNGSIIVPPLWRVVYIIVLQQIPGSNKNANVFYLNDAKDHFEKSMQNDFSIME